MMLIKREGTGLVGDASPPTGNVNNHERVIYPLRTTWNANGNARQASSYSCR
jgi:hypothetical protein